MNQTAKIAVAVTGGYILGRRKKAKLAIGVGLYLAGKKLNISPKQISDLVMKEIGGSEQLAALRQQAQGEVATLGKAAVGALVDRQANRVADVLHLRAERLNESPSDETGEDAEETEDAEDTEDTARAGDENGDENGESADESRTEDEAPRKQPAKRRSTGSSRSGGTRAKSGSSRQRQGTGARRQKTAGSES